MKVIFSDLAIETLSEIVEFLLINWTEKEISVMENDIESFVENVQAQFKIYPISKYDKNLREALIGNKQAKIFFEKVGEEIHVLLFWPNKRNPEKLITFLKNKL